MQRAHGKQQRQQHQHEEPPAAAAAITQPSHMPQEAQEAVHAAGSGSVPDADASALLAVHSMPAAQTATATAVTPAASQALMPTAPTAAATPKPEQPQASAAELSKARMMQLLARNMGLQQELLQKDHKRATGHQQFQAEASRMVGEAQAQLAGMAATTAQGQQELQQHDSSIAQMMQEGRQRAQEDAAQHAMSQALQQALASTARQATRLHQQTMPRSKNLYAQADPIIDQARAVQHDVASKAAGAQPAFEGSLGVGRAEMQRSTAAMVQALQPAAAAAARAQSMQAAVAQQQAARASTAAVAASNRSQASTLALQQQHVEQQLQQEGAAVAQTSAEQQELQQQAGSQSATLARLQAGQVLVGSTLQQESAEMGQLSERAARARSRQEDVMREVAARVEALRQAGLSAEEQAQELSRLLQQLNSSPWDEQLQLQAMALLTVLQWNGNRVASMMMARRSEVVAQGAFSAAVSAPEEVDGMRALLFLAAQHPRRYLALRTTCIGVAGMQADALKELQAERLKQHK